MQKAVALRRYRLENPNEDKDICSNLKNKPRLRHALKSKLPVPVFQDSCGDCGTSEKNKASQKNNLRKRHQQFTPSSLRKIPSCEGSKLIKEHKYITFNLNRSSQSLSSDSGKNVFSFSRGSTPSTNGSRFIVKLRELNEFFKLTEDRVIQDFLKADSCKKIADKYLIAMVFAYFKRANLELKDYTRFNFFICLYLANDMEEDEEEQKYEMFPWLLGPGWRQRYMAVLRGRDALLRRIGYKAAVSRRCCDEIMAIEPTHPIWQRERPIYHAGAIRGYMKGPEEDGIPRGPNHSPRHCPDCEAPDSQYDSASPASTVWYISSRESSPCTSSSQTSSGSQPSDDLPSLNVKDLRGTLPDTEVWPSTEE